MYKICFYVPDSHVEEVKNAMFAQGAGKIGEYSHCAWQILGEGQFMASNQSNPFLGQRNQIEKVKEYKVEMVCADDYLSQVIAALKTAHPYEEPAYQMWRFEV